jgi:peptidyl-tRNA hydrolase, PTH1 family
MGTPIELIVGLGNPGPEYQTTRHNVGFWFVDLLAREQSGSFKRERKLHGEATEVRIARHRIRLLKPTTYMNLSGQAVSAAVSYYKIPVECVLVAYDELDLPPGRVQLRFGGGTAGHNGVENVVEHAGADFWRLRFGVGHPRNRAHDPGKPVIDHVLDRADADEERQIREMLEEAAAVIPIMLELGAERAKNRLHARKPKQPPAEEPE